MTMLPNWRQLLTVVAVVIVAVLGNHPSSSPDKLQIDLGYEIHQGHFNATGQFYNFSNIRYAAPPVGKLRFAPPVSPSTRHKVFNNGLNFAICPNAGPAWSSVANKWLTEGIGSINITAGYTIPNITTAPPALAGTNEDCLFLDVLVPKEVFDDDMREKGAPVVVWIHGGGYTLGWKTRYGSGVGLINASRRNNKEGIIYVAINYRLGLFGFLSGKTFTDQHGTPNVGLLDQRFALQWVQKHISKFGGDPHHVIVMGESAGGGSIIHQITAYGGQGKKGKAPFQQAIIQSGAFLPVPGMARQEAIYAKFLKVAGVQTLDQARDLSTEKLQFVNAKLVGESPYGDFTFNPAVDGTFSPSLPGKLLLTNQYDQSLRLLIGHNADEGLYFTSPFILTPSTFTQNIISVSFPNADANNVTSYILNTLYPDVLDGTYGYTNEIARGALIVSEAIFECNALYLSRAFGLDNRYSNGKPNTYSYLFSVPPALHGDDIYYTFYEGPTPSVKNDTLALIMQGYFTNFVREGDPNGDGLPEFESYGERTAAGEGVVMDLGLESARMRTDDLPLDRCGWWQQALYA